MALYSIKKIEKVIVKSIKEFNELEQKYKSCENNFINKKVIEKKIKLLGKLEIVVVQIEKKNRKEKCNNYIFKILNKKYYL